MYHINVNSPPVESTYAVFESTTLPSAALHTHGSLTPDAYSLSLKKIPSRVRAWSRSSRCPCSPSSQAEPLQEREYETILIAAWGQYQTLNQMRASPYYICINLPVFPDTTTVSPLPFGPTHSAAASESLDVQAEQTHSERYLTLHAVHPIPMTYLRSLAHHQLYFLYEYLIGKVFRPSGKLAKRLCQTMDCIRQIMHQEQRGKHV
jgi:hypothetical protein